MIPYIRCSCCDGPVEKVGEGDKAVWLHIISHPFYRSKLPSRDAFVNAVTCLWCNSYIVSRYRHDFVGCKCEDDKKKVYVDGGWDYSKRVMGKESSFLEESERLLTERRSDLL